MFISSQIKDWNAQRHVVKTASNRSDKELTDWWKDRSLHSTFIAARGLTAWISIKTSIILQMFTASWVASNSYLLQVLPVSLSLLLLSLLQFSADQTATIITNTRMWANAQRDGRPAEYRWRPLFNAAKFGWRLLLECRAVTLPRRKTRMKFVGVPQTPEPISAVSRPKFTMVCTYVDEVVLFNKFFCDGQ